MRGMACGDRVDEAYSLWPDFLPSHFRLERERNP